MTGFNAPSGVQVATTHNWIGSNAAYNLIKPQIDPKEAKVWGTQDITGWIEMLGGKNYVAGISYRHFEEDRIHQIIVAAGTGTGTVGDVITYTIDTTDYIANYPTSAVEPYVATGTQVNLIPVRKDEVLIFPNGAQGIVTSVTPSGPTFTVASTNGIALPTTTDADEIIDLGISMGEQKGTGTTFNFRESVYYNMTEIMTDKHTASGTSLGEQNWIEYEWRGQMQSKWWFKGQSATFKRFRNFREMKFVAGEKVTGATGINAYDPTLTRTEGLIPFSSSYNSTNTFNLASGLTLGDWETIFIDQIDKNAGTTEYTGWAAINVRQAIDGFVRSEMKEGGVQYAAFEGGQKQAVDFGFDSFETLGYTSHLMTYQPFNNPTMLGANGHKYKNLCILVPTNKEIYAIGETKQKTEVPPMRINYVKNGTTNREWAEWLLGGTDGVYTTDTDEITINFRSHGGFEGFGANRWSSIKGVAA